MSDSITCSVKSLILAVAAFLRISVGALCEFAMAPDVHILLSPQEEELHSSYWGKRCAQSAAHSSKRFKPLPAKILLRQGFCWIGENHYCIIGVAKSNLAEKWSWQTRH